MPYQVSHWIKGQAISGPKHQDIYNPALGEIIGEVNFAGEALCNQAVIAAREALQGWSQTTPVKRARHLFRFRDLLEKHQLELAQMVTREHGKTIEDAKGSVARAIEVVEWHCGLLSAMQGTFTANIATEIDCYTQRQPLGVCVGVSPFNFPIMVPVSMMIPAIAYGNTFILKPSEQDPSAPIRLMELLQEAGIPDGVVNCLQGDKSTIDHLIHHPEVVALTAVASTPVAKYIYTQATSLGKRAQTFGGAKNHGVLMPDAHIEHAAAAIAGAAFGAAGERCMALSVIVTVGEHTADALCQHLLPLIQAIQIDAGDVPGADMGPLISKAHRERVLSAIGKGIEEGATLKLDGRTYRHPQYPQGYFLGPTLFDHVSEAMSIYQQEIFGPVLVIVRVANFNDALALVNRNQYGNGATIFTQDGFTAREFVQKVQVGMVGVNVPIPVPIASHPFGGWKHSSFGDSNMHGLESLHFYSKLKTVTSKWPSSSLAEKTFSMPTHHD